MKVIAEGLQFPEGPIAMADGSVILVEIARSTLSRVRPDGTVEVVARCGGGPNGAALGPDGAVYVCNNGGFTWRHVDGMTLPGVQPDDYTGGSIQRVELDSGAVTTLYTEAGGWPLAGPTTSCSIAAAASTSRTSARAEIASSIGVASITPSPTDRRSRSWPDR